MCDYGFVLTRDYTSLPPPLPVNMVVLKKLSLYLYFYFPQYGTAWLCGLDQGEQASIQGHGCMGTCMKKLENCNYAVSNKLLMIIMLQMKCDKMFRSVDCLCSKLKKVYGWKCFSCVLFEAL